MCAIVEDGKMPWDGVASSPLIRCAAFAEELAKRHGLPLKLEPRFRELDFGEWEGESWTDLYREAGGPLLEFQRQPGRNPAPGGEHYWDFEARVGKAWGDLLDTARDRHWLLVCHAGVVRTLLRLVLGFPVGHLFSIQAPYAGLTRIEQEGGNPARLVFHGGRL